MAQPIMDKPALSAAVGQEITVRKRRSKLGRHQAFMGFVFISPAMLLFLIFALLPAITAFVLSFTNYDILSEAKWVGTSNYERLWRDETFFITLRNIVFYAILFIPANIALSLLLALALNRKVPGMKIFRIMYYFPIVTSTVAASTVWIWLLNKDYGVLNQFLAIFGINGPAWLSNSDTAMFAVVMVTLWQGLGGNMIVYLAGLQGIPTYLYEAARLDGANYFQLLRYVTWPALRTTTFFISTTGLIGAFQLFDQAYVMTKGGPANATRTPVYHIWDTGFSRLQMGYASSLAVVLFCIILIITVFNLWANRNQYEGLS